MTERLGKNLRALTAAGILAASAAEAGMVDVPNFPADGNPAVIGELLRPAAQTSGHLTEAVAISIKVRDRYISAAADPGFGIIQSTEYLRLLKELQKKYNIQLDGMEIWLAHNHAVDDIIALALARGLSRDIFTNPQALLNGPSLNDCERFFNEKKLFKDYTNTTVINLVVEPGGNWVCSGTYPSEGFSDAIDAAYTILRQKLVIATQSKKSGLRGEIHNFETHVLNLTGMRLKFVPHGSSVEELEKAKEGILRLK